MWCVAWWWECEPSTMSCCVPLVCCSLGCCVRARCARAHVRAAAPARTRIFIRTRTHMCPSMGGVAVRTSPLTPSLVRSPLSPACPRLFPPSVLLALLSRPLVPACYLRGVLLVCLLCCACVVLSHGVGGVCRVVLLCCSVCGRLCVSERVWCFVVPGLVASCVVRGVVVGG